MQVIFIDTVHPALKEMLETKGVKCIMHHTTSQQELELMIHKYDGIVIRSRFKLDKHFLSKATSLKFIARSGAGLENIDLEYCKQKNITCFNSPEGNRDAVGEHALGMLLMLFNNLKKADAEVRKGIWKREENRGTEIAGRTIGIIGYGNMGSAFARKLIGFDCSVIAYDKYRSGFGNEMVKEVTLNELQQKADVISLHVPLTSETNYLVNKDFIDSCTKPFYLINTARGKNVNTEDLVFALKERKIKGACLDVLEYEHSSFENIDKDKLPAAFQFLTDSENVILSPHIAGWTHESYYKLSYYLAEKIIKHFKL